MSITKKLYSLIFIVVIGFISLNLLNNYFNLLIKKTDLEQKNYLAKLQIADFISYDINKLNALFSELMVYGDNAKIRNKLKKDINKKVDEVLKLLNVLKDGGVLERKIYLNLVDKSDSSKYINFITKKITYQKTSSEIPVAVISLFPKIKQLNSMANDISRMIKLKSRFKNNLKRLKIISKRIKRYYKSIPAYFARMEENVNKLLYDSDKELHKIQKKIEIKKEKYTYLRLALIVVIILITLVLGIWITNNVDKNNKKLKVLNKTLKEKEKFVKAIIDGQTNIVIVSDGIEMIAINKAIIKFFNQFKTVEEFTSKHSCICDLFKDDVPDDTYIVKKDYDGLNWLEYILANKDKVFKVIMNNGIEDHHFIISANENQISDSQKIVVVSLNDITEEIKSKQELAKLNKNLQSIVEEKTKELKKLNKDLEKRVQEEVAKNIEKDKQLLEQSKLAAMGEMIGNIAHQWRQPLSAISTSATGMLMQKQLGILTDEQFEKFCETINVKAQYLSKTIDDFRNFIKGDRKKRKFSIKDLIDGFLSLEEGIIKNNNINLHLNIDENIEINGYKNELTQCLINIVNNAKDALNEKVKEGERLVFIDAYQENDLTVIQIKDNAGGIPDNIISKIFEPYFTTKHQSQGTGLGLSMTYNIITEGMNGEIFAKNIIYRYEDKEYKGALFTIKLPNSDRK